MNKGNNNKVKVNENIKNALRTLPSMGMAFIVLGVLLLASSLVMGIKGNAILFAGLLLIVAGAAGFVFSLRK